jgi:hypothetical protein
MEAHNRRDEHRNNNNNNNNNDIMPAAVIPDIVMDDDSRSLSAQSACGDVYNKAGGSVNDERMDEMAHVRRDRERDGRCGQCGIQTHEIEFDLVSHVQVKVPLTIPREVHRGRCLLCYPLFTSLPMQASMYMNAPCAAVPRPAHPYALSSLQSQSQSQPSVMPMVPRRVSQLEAHFSGGSRESSLPMFHQQQHHRQQHQHQHQNYHEDPVLRHALSVLYRTHFEIADILHVMKTLAHDDLIQEKACERLWILSWDEDNAAAIGRVGGIHVILQAMSSFPMNARLQLCAGESLQNLALHNEYNCYEICEQGGVSLIVQAMMRHGENAGIQQCGCTALGNIARSNVVYHAHIMSSGSLIAIMRAAKSLSHVESVVRAAKDALQALGCSNAVVEPTDEAPISMMR